MSFTRRTFLAGTGAGFSLLVLTACVTEQPKPVPSPTRTATGIVPQPAAVLRSSWGSDSFARGSVSYAAVGSTVDHRDALRQPLGNRVFFAGEATSSEHPGTVLGAQQSGSLAAADLADAASIDERVAIIGAGAAGAEAARVLTLRGYEVTVIEARARVGGRIQSVTRDEWPFPVELGAWRLSPVGDTDLVDSLSSLGVVTVPLGTEDGQSLYRSTTGEAAADPVGAPAVASALAWAVKQPRDVSLQTALTDSGAEKTAADTAAGELTGAELLTQHLESIATSYGAEANQLSSWFTVDDTAPPSLVTGGFDTVITDALEGVKTFLSTTVLGIVYSDKRVSLRLGTGESLSVDRVIVTVPLGVLQDNSIDFDPLLPFAHRAAINALGMGTIDTVWLRFDEPFWSTDAVVWNLVGTEFEVTTWYNLEPLTGESILVGLVGGDAALRLEKLDDAALTERLLATLAPFAS